MIPKDKMPKQKLTECFLNMQVDISSKETTGRILRFDKALFISSKTVLEDYVIVKVN
jgi:hypothetical protein